MRSLLILTFCCAILLSKAQPPRILLNQVGYEQDKPKRAIIESNTREIVASFKLIDDSTGKLVYTGKPAYSGPVAKWKHWQFYTLDFSTYTKPGVYRLQAVIKNQPT